MPIDFSKSGMKKPEATSSYTREQVEEFMACAKDILYFAENYYYIVHPVHGKNLIELYDFQKQLLRNFQNNRFNVVLSARQMGKALSLNTPVITPNGFTTVGEIKEGDVIYGRDGKKTNVTYITEVMNNRKMYDVEFDNGEVVTACSEHLWNVSTSDWERKGCQGEQTMDTDRMLSLFESLQSRSKPARPFIKKCDAVLFDEQQVSIHPYVLGLWLGDGNTNDGRITCSQGDYDHYKNKLNSLGYTVSNFRPDKRRGSTGNFNVVGLVSKLNYIGVKGNKHIPDNYMFNSVKNRVQLVQGLMDSDGYAEKNGTLQFYQSNEELFDQVRFVIHSLGVKTHKTTKKTEHKDCFKATFVCDDYDLFCLSRKLDRQHSKKHTNPKNNRHYIVSIKEVESCPARCLQVDNEDHLFLCGNTLIPTHNTTCSCIYLLWFAMFNPDKQLAVLANKQRTAIEIVGDIKVAYKELPDWLKPGIEKWDRLEIAFDNGSGIFAAPTSQDAIRGSSPSVLFLDEFAFVPQNIADEFWASNYPAISAGGNIIVVSTPNGAAGLFYDIFTKAKNGKNSFCPNRITWDQHPDRGQEWKEEQLANMDEKKFMQEFECSFEGSSMTLINGDVLSNLQPVDPHYMIEDGLFFWKKPVQGRKYLLGVDIGQGAGSDYSVVSVFDITDFYTFGRYEQVGLFRRNDIPIFIFKDKVLQIAYRFNSPVIICENNNYKFFAEQMYMDDQYEHIWYDYEKVGEYGVNANSKSKPLALTYFKKDVEEGRMIINSSELVKELAYFEEVSLGIYKARKGREYHDDVVASCYWVSYALRSKYLVDYMHYEGQRDDTRRLHVQDGFGLEGDGESLQDESILDAFSFAMSKGSYASNSMTQPPMPGGPMRRPQRVRQAPPSRFLGSPSQGMMGPPAGHNNKYPMGRPKPGRLF